MKKIVIILAALLLTVGANAQMKFGAKAGLNLSQLSATTTKIDGEADETEEATGMLPSFFVSGHVNFGLGQFFGVQPELMFSMQGGKESDGDFDVSMHFNYINIPILFEVKPITNFSLFVGPQIGFNLYKGTTGSLEGGSSATISGSDFEDVLKSAGMKFNTIDFAAVVGVQYKIMEHFLISARYNLGFTPTIKSDVDGATISGGSNRVIQIGIGWQF